MTVDALATDPHGWSAFNSKARRHLTDRDLDWLVEGASLFTQKHRIDQAICTTFDNPDWWSAWRDWRNECQNNWSTKSNGRPPTPGRPILSYPPDEPVGLWEKAEHLLVSGTYLESVSAALIRLLLAQGRVAREMLQKRPAAGQR